MTLSASGCEALPFVENESIATRGFNPSNSARADCDDAMSCGDALVCVEDPIPGEVGLQYCAPPCDPDGDGSECPPAPPDTEVTPTCVDRHDGTGVCGLDCLGGYTCPQGMSCFDGWLCVWEP